MEGLKTINEFILDTVCIGEVPSRKQGLDLQHILLTACNANSSYCGKIHCALKITVTEEGAEQFKPYMNSLFSLSQLRCLSTLLHHK